MSLYVLTGNTGSGKSSYFDQFNQKLIFACASNSQAFDQYQSYISRNPKKSAMLWQSSTYKIAQKFNIKPIMHPKQHVWNTPRPDWDAIRKQIPATDTHAFNQLITANDQFDKKADIIFTTHSRLKSMSPSESANYILVFDDVTLDTFNYFFTSKQLYNDVYIAEGAFKTSIQSVKIDRSTYFIIPPKHRLLPIKTDSDVYFTTTDDLCSDYLISHNSAIPIELTSISAGDNYLIHPSVLTRSKFKPEFIELMKSIDGSVIADGVDSELNHVTVCGLNSLSTTNILTKISQPHLSHSLKTYHFLIHTGSDITKQDTLLELMMHQLIQSIGRNQGHRFNEAEFIAVVDPILYEYLLDIGFPISQLKSSYGFITDCLELIKKYEADVDRSILITKKEKDDIKLDKLLSKINDLIKEGKSKRIIYQKLNIGKKKYITIDQFNNLFNHKGK